MEIKIIDGVEYVKFEEVKLERRLRVENVMNTLSYSETLGIRSVFKELEGKEGVLVTSSIADKVNITRSVIVNGLRKFESAGLIYSKSLGMKGTYIKVIDATLLDILGEVE